MRGIWTVALAVLANVSLSIFATAPAATPSCNKALAETQAKLEIEYLRRKYAKATDLIGRADVASIAQGKALYHEAFTADAKYRVSNPDGEPLTADGPDSWADIVLSVLEPYGPTQHLIGTQLVDILELELSASCEPVKGRAHMESYVQAWHDTKPTEIWMFMGTYIDEVVYQPGKGWRIAEMQLVSTTTETRQKTAK